ncbi:WXG100 family type VII secretion target [Nocardia mexicana]|uniref:Uncharacterized protein YukE n=1 Tax=Nocardia mexicana TaxID=279262 RepID=A0A370GT77_9NOCA|nr:type VII secretion target [Nocardia mexicana]RDI46466.1 uncharacterized protein YukE [Nocardia mexicana]
MVDRIELDPAKLREAAAEFEDIAERCRRTVDKLQDAIQSRGQVWGDDKIGEKFAKGEQGYESGRDNMIEAIDGRISLLNDNANQIRQAAEEFECVEDRSRDMLAPRVQSRRHPTG